MGSALRERIEAFLGAHQVMTLATAGRAGPWAAAVFYASEGFTLYFVSVSSSRHALDIEANGAVAATIHGECADWREIRGLQLEGTASRLTGTARASAALCYGRKHPLVANLALAPAAIVAAMAKIDWYQVAPRRVRLIDNTLGFGHKEELTLEP